MPELLEPSEAPFPEKAPAVARKIRFHAYEWIGIAVFLAVVVAALSGAFGNSFGRREAANADLAAELRHPTRFRYKEIAPLELWVENRSGRSLGKLTVSFAPDYVRAFSNVSFLPSAKRPYEVELTDLPAGARQLVTVQLQAERYGSHAGEVRIRGDGVETLAIAVETLVFP